MNPISFDMDIKSMTITRREGGQVVATYPLTPEGIMGVWNDAHAAGASVAWSGGFNEGWRRGGFSERQKKAPQEVESLTIMGTSVRPTPLIEVFAGGAF